MRRHKVTEEEKVAVTISKIVTDLRLDLDLIGVYLAYYLPNVAYRRFQEIAEASKEAKEGKSNDYEY